MVRVRAGEGWVHCSYGLVLRRPAQASGSANREGADGSGAPPSPGPSSAHPPKRSPHPSRGPTTAGIVDRSAHWFLGSAFPVPLFHRMPRVPSPAGRGDLARSRGWSGCGPGVAESIAVTDPSSHNLRTRRGERVGQPGRGGRLGRRSVASLLPRGSREAGPHPSRVPSSGPPRPSLSTGPACGFRDQRFPSLYSSERFVHSPRREEGTRPRAGEGLARSRGGFG